MRNLIALFFSIAFSALSTWAGTGDAAFKQTVAAYKNSGGISVDYAIASDASSYRGTIIMQQNKFRIHSSDMICWFDGKTQWSYSTMSDEVSIMQPTADELQAVNPFSIISNFQASYNATLAKSTTSETILKLTPKNPKNSDIRSVSLHIDKSTNLPTKIIFTMSDKSTTTISLSGYRTGGKFPSSLFTFDKKLVPDGTPVIDLR